MKKIEIYEFQLKEILNALRLTSRIHKSNGCVTCFDRIIIEAKNYTKNALEGKIDERVGYGIKESQNPTDLSILVPIIYIDTPEHKATIKYGSYLVVRKDGKTHLETFNGTGWAYNHKSIVAYYLPKIN